MFKSKYSTFPRLSTFCVTGLGWFTLPRRVAETLSTDQIIAAGLLVLQSGE